MYDRIYYQVKRNALTDKVCGVSHSQLCVIAVGIETPYMLDCPNPFGSEIFRTRSDRPWGSPSLLYNGYRVFPGGKAAWAWR